ncbi:unnamed protein product, partial [Tilletia controversa]
MDQRRHRDRPVSCYCFGRCAGRSERPKKVIARTRDKHLAADEETLIKAQERGIAPPPELESAIDNNRCSIVAEAIEDSSSSSEASDYSEDPPPSSLNSFQDPRLNREGQDSASLQDNQQDRDDPFPDDLQDDFAFFDDFDFFDQPLQNQASSTDSDLAEEDVGEDGFDDEEDDFFDDEEMEREVDRLVEGE